jgi:hypothetical protein
MVMMVPAQSVSIVFPRCCRLLQANVRMSPTPYTILRVMVEMSTDKENLAGEEKERRVSCRVGGARGGVAGFRYCGMRD